MAPQEILPHDIYDKCPYPRGPYPSHLRPDRSSGQETKMRLSGGEQGRRGNPSCCRGVKSLRGNGQSIDQLQSNNHHILTCHSLSRVWAQVVVKETRYEGRSGVRGWTRNENKRRAESVSVYNKIQNMNNQAYPHTPT